MCLCVCLCVYLCNVMQILMMMVTRRVIYGDECCMVTRTGSDQGDEQDDDTDGDAHTGTTNSNAVIIDI